MIRKIVVMLMAVLLMAGPVESLYAQQKKPAAKTQAKAPAKKPQGKSQPKAQAKAPAKKNSSQTAAKSAAKNNAANNTTATPPKKLSRAEYEKQQRDLQKQIAATEKMISENDQSVIAQNRDIELRKDEIGKRRALLVSMQLEIESIKDEEDSLSRVIVQLTQDFQNKQEKFTAAVKHIFRWRSGYDEWMFILSSEDLLTGMRRMRYLSQYSKWRKKEALALEQQRLATEAVRQRLSLVRADREELRGSLERERQTLSNKQRIQEEAVASLKKRNRELQGELVKAQKKQREVQKVIQQLIEEERRKAEAARKKAEAEERKKQSGSKTGGTSSSAGNSGSSSNTSKDEALTYYSPAEVAQLTGSFRQNKGKMPYPLDSNFAFLSHYTADGNYSINLSTAVGAHACAIFEGTVLRVARSSEDFTIIISHGEYMTVYSNLSAAHVKEGDKVKMRQSVGIVKSDLDGRRAQLMFWIYGKTDAENPELWLKK